jgi:hypothetical protein
MDRQLVTQMVEDLQTGRWPEPDGRWHEREGRFPMAALLLEDREAHQFPPVLRVVAARDVLVAVVTRDTALVHAAATKSALAGDPVEAVLRRMGFGPDGHARLGFDDRPFYRIAWLYSDDHTDVDTPTYSGLGGIGFAFNLDDAPLSEWGLHPFAMDNEDEAAHVRRQEEAREDLRRFLDGVIGEMAGMIGRAMTESEEGEAKGRGRVTKGEGSGAHGVPPGPGRARRAGRVGKKTARAGKRSRPGVSVADSMDVRLLGNTPSAAIDWIQDTVRSFYPHLTVDDDDPVAVGHRSSAMRAIRQDMTERGPAFVTQVLDVLMGLANIHAEDVEDHSDGVPTVEQIAVVLVLGLCRQAADAQGYALVPALVDKSATGAFRRTEELQQRAEEDARRRKEG